MVLRDELIVAGDPPEEEKEEETENKEEEEEEEEEETNDPYELAKRECKQADECAKFRSILEVCSKRVALTGAETEETCEEEVMDFVHCVDHCAARGLFDKLK